MTPTRAPITGIMRSITILIVEDEVDVRNVMLIALVRAGYLVLEADSAAAALEVSNIFEDVIDLLIADHALKTMTGREVAAEISRSRLGLKVLYISGYPLETLQKEAGGESLSRADFLAKPFLPKDLVGKVKEILRSAGEENRRAVSSVH